MKSPQFDIPEKIENVVEVAWTEGQAICALIDGPDGEVLLEGDGSRADFLVGSKSYFAPVRFEQFQAFVNELNEAFPDPEHIEDVYGVSAVFGVLKLQQAIMMDTKIDVHSKITELISILPSGSLWKTYLKKKKRTP